MEVLVTKVDAVRDHGDSLTIVTVGEHEVVANKQEDGTPRWVIGEPVIYVPEGAIVPDDVLQERGYWDNEKNKGLLEGKKGNRVKMRRFAGFESRGLLFKISKNLIVWKETLERESSLNVFRGDTMLKVDDGDNVAEFLGITEYIPN